MKKSVIGGAVSRRTLLISTASVILIAPILHRRIPTATATTPTMTYGRGYRGGY